MADLAAQGVPAAGATTVDLVEVARRVVAAVAPEQADLLTAVTTRWDERQRQGWTGGSVGSGIEPVLLAEVVLPVLLGASSEVLGAAAVAAWQQRPRWAVRRRPKEAPVMSVTLDAGQIQELRAACLRHATALGMSEAEAAVLTDAVMGVLYRAAAESPPADG